MQNPGNISDGKHPMSSPLMDTPDNAGGSIYQAPTMRTPPLASGNDGKAMQIDGPYGGKKPQG